MNIIFDKMEKGELMENNYIDNKIIIGNIRKMKEIEKKSQR